LKKIAKTLQAHRQQILNRVRARGMISTGTVEEMSNRLKVITRRAYGFRTYRAIEVALYHTLGKLPICRAYPPIDSTDERKKEGRLWPPRTN